MTPSEGRRAGSKVRRRGLSFGRACGWSARWIGGAAGIVCVALFITTLWAGLGAVNSRGSGVYTVMGFFHVGDTWFGSGGADGFKVGQWTIGGHWVSSLRPLTLAEKLRLIPLWPRFERGTPTGTPGWHLTLPLVTPGVVFLALSGLAWWRHRPRRAGCCESCGYDRAGLATTAACPECGASPPMHVGREG